MKQTNNVRLTKNIEGLRKETETSTNHIKQGGANSTFPQEYEEQLTVDIRMKSQPFVKLKKRVAKNDNSARKSSLNFLRHPTIDF